MEDKEKQIEQMAKIMCGHDCEECAKETADWRGVSLEEAKAEQCLIKKRAELLYNAGCRIIPKDSVVVSREDYNEFLRQAFIIDELKDCVKLARKETAKELLEDFDNHGVYSQDYTNFMRKQFGVEVKE